MFEYKVVPAPVKGIKTKGVKAPEARFALGVEAAINALAADGWEYLRSDVLPSEERVGLTGSETHWRTLLVFRRALVKPPAPDTAQARVEPVLTAAQADVAETASDAAQTPATKIEFEEGLEETRPA